MGPGDQRKVALITGGNKGIGRAIALELSREGYVVVPVARDEAMLKAVQAEIAEQGGEAHYLVADLTQENSEELVFKFVSETFGRLDVLVNNAGNVRRGDFLTQPKADWYDGFALKFFSHVWLSRALWPLLAKSNGSIVFISGIGARVPVADYMIGAAVIGASLAFMKSLADMAKKDGIQVLAINPGSVHTDRLAHRLKKIRDKTGLSEDEALEHHRKELDITRFGLPEDVSALVAFAISEKGRWLHGTGIDIDGGQVDPLRMSRYD